MAHQIQKLGGGAAESLSVGGGRGIRIRGGHAPQCTTRRAAKPCLRRHTPCGTRDVPDLGQTMTEFPTWAEVDLDRFGRNIAAIQAAIGHGCRILLVVKADAYGHGAVEISRAAMDAGVTMLGVATLHEGIELRSAGFSASIRIISTALPS